MQATRQQLETHRRKHYRKATEARAQRDWDGYFHHLQIVARTDRALARLGA